MIIKPEYSKHREKSDLLEPIHYRVKYDYDVDFEVGVILVITEFSTLKETKCGYWIAKGRFDKARWVSKTTKKRYAYLTKKEALNNFEIRNQRRIGYLRDELELREGLFKDIKELASKIDTL